MQIKGKLIFDPDNKTKKHLSQSQWKKAVIVKWNCDIHSYYSWFIEKRFNLILNPPLRGTHITIVNEKVNDKIYSLAKKQFDGKEITFNIEQTEFESGDEGHWWLKVNSRDAENIRRAMGLNPKPYFDFHLTIGIATHLRLIHSNYIREIIRRFPEQI